MTEWSRRLDTSRSWLSCKFLDTVVLNVILYSLQMQLQPELGIGIAPKAQEKWFGLSSYNIEITVDGAEISGENPPAAGKKVVEKSSA